MGGLGTALAFAKKGFKHIDVYENAPKGQGDSEARTVFDLVMQRPGNPKEGILVTLGVPASDAARGMKLLALLKQNMRINW